MEVKRENFSISGIEFAPKEVVKVKGVIMYPDQDHKDRSFNDKLSHYPHPDLTKHFRGDLRLVVLKVMGYLKVFDYKDSEKLGDIERDAFRKLSIFEKTMNNQVTDQIKVTGIEFKGNEKTDSVVIKFRYNPWGLSKDVEQRTPTINLGSDIYGIEEILLKMKQEIEDSAFDYAIKMKSGDIPMFPNEENEDDEDEDDEDYSNEDTPESED